MSEYLAYEDLRDDPRGARSLAEAYAKKGETALAIRNYEKSLELNAENDNAVAMLEKLRPGRGS